MLIEIARRTGSYVPDLSFGTHFFQDLVEAQIRYLPLYPTTRASPSTRGSFATRPTCSASWCPSTRRSSRSCG
jgi:hypothetical protein